MSPSDFDVVIIGSGVLGSALACTLARQGRKVAVVERDLSEPNRIVGELLQPGECLEGFESQVLNGGIINDTNPSATYTLEFPPEEDKLITGACFHHGRFIQSMRNCARKELNTTYYEGTVREFIKKDDVITGVEYKDRATGKLEYIEAPLTIVADGCFSKFRKNLVKKPPTITSHFVGLLLKNCPQAKPNFMEYCLMQPSLAIVYRISETDTRCLVNLKGDIPNNLQQYLINTVAPNLPEHIRPSFVESARKERPACMPNGWLATSPIIRPGVMCLGDAVNMRHAITGAGMSVALNDVVLFRDIFEPLADFRDTTKVMSTARKLYTLRRDSRSLVANTMSMLVYQLLSSDDSDMIKLKEASYEYFKLGLKVIPGTISLLSIRTPDLAVLRSHLLHIILYAAFRQFRLEPWWSVHRSVTSCLAILYKSGRIVLPLLWAENSI